MTGRRGGGRRGRMIASTSLSPLTSRVSFVWGRSRGEERGGNSIVGMLKNTLSGCSETSTSAQRLKSDLDRMNAEKHDLDGDICRVEWGKEMTNKTLLTGEKYIFSLFHFSLFHFSFFIFHFSSLIFHFVF